MHTMTRPYHGTGPHSVGALFNCEVKKLLVLRVYEASDKKLHKINDTNVYLGITTMPRYFVLKYSFCYGSPAADTLWRQDINVYACHSLGNRRLHHTKLFCGEQNFMFLFDLFSYSVNINHIFPTWSR